MGQDSTAPASMADITAMGVTVAGTVTIAAAIIAIITMVRAERVCVEAAAVALVVSVKLAREADVLAGLARVGAAGTGAATARTTLMVK